MAFSRCVFLILLCAGLSLAGCSRSPREQLAYQHAEEQYQINQRRAQHLGDRGPAENAEPLQDESVATTPVRQ